MSAARQLTLDFEHRPALGDDDFLIAPCNAEAVAWLDRWPLWGAPVLAIHGPAGCGKTHLAHVFMGRAEATLVDARDVVERRPDELFGGGSALVIDDAQVLAGDPKSEEALFHLYNHLMAGGGSVLLTSRTPTARWDYALDDLRSRLRAAPSVAIGAPDDGLIGAVLVKLFADRQLRVEQGVLDYLLARMDRSFEFARRLVAEMDRSALAARRKITVPLARDVLNRFDLAPNGRAEN